jgi:hypothetical protein
VKDGKTFDYFCWNRSFVWKSKSWLLWSLNKDCVERLTDPSHARTFDHFKGLHIIVMGFLLAFSKTSLGWRTERCNSDMVVSHTVMEKSR